MDALLDYVLLHFYSLYGSPSRPFDIHYGLNGTSSVQISRSDLSFFESNDPFPEKVRWEEWGGRQIPFFFPTPEEGPLLRIRDGQAIITQDVISSAFYLLSGWQEFHSPSRDRFHRFPYEASVQYRHQFITVPVVNYYFDLLKEAIEQAQGITLSSRLWGGAPFATCVTHDVDRYESAWKIASQEELRRGNVKAASRLLWQKLQGRDAWSNLPEVMGVLEKYGAEATFFFLPNHAKHQGHPNADYDISTPRYQKLLAEVERRGHEVGVHGSFKTATHAGYLLQEAARLQRPVQGNRFHYLCYDPSVTADVLKESGLKYDSTLGFPEHFGFRNGYCLPFWPFDFKNRRPYPFLEIPLHLMDVTLHHPHYLQVPPAEMFGAVKPMLEEIIKFRGCFTLLWHNENFSDHAFPGGRAVFEEIISYAASQKTVFLTGSQVWAELEKGTGGKGTLKTKPHPWV
ncbi:polysaccharide deacetylase family protein [soil metagenome]